VGLEKDEEVFHFVCEETNFAVQVNGIADDDFFKGIGFEESEDALDRFSAVFACLDGGERGGDDLVFIRDGNADPFETVVETSDACFWHD
jgi:hypothetical protein